MTATDGLSLHGQRALVTGASRGVGATIARTLARAGADVVVGYRADDRAARTTVDAIADGGGTARAIRANLQRPEEIRALVDAVRADGALDILVHAAALGSFKPLLDVRPNQWDLTMAVGPRAFLLCAREAAALMDDRQGRIIALSSLGATRVVPSYGAIGVSKAATEAVVRYLAIELAARDIAVNGVAAGVIANTSIARHEAYDALVDESRRRTPSGRLTTAEDVAGVVLFLCSPLARSIAGQTLVVDGGMSVPI